MTLVGIKQLERVLAPLPLPVLHPPVYRPPSEGENLIVQATLGCSFNRCTFCSMYKQKAYRPRPLEEVSADIGTAARWWPSAHRIFLADGDALTLPTDHLIALLTRLAAAFPALQRVTSYATPGNLLHKSPDELAALRAAGLRLVYVGIETGSDAILRRVAKGANADMIARALQRAREAEIKVSATVILGLGGRTLWQDHIIGTLALLNRAPVTYLSTLQLMLAPHERPAFLERFGRAGIPFAEQDDDGILAEQAALLTGLRPPSPIIFRSNHASNCLALAGTLPRDQARLCAVVEAARQGIPLLRPGSMRCL